jgi:hypothetical protein
LICDKDKSHDSVVLSAFRDLSYPLGVGSYDTYAIPRRGFITAVDWTGDKVRLSGDIEMINKFQRRYSLVRMPLSSIPPDVLKRAAPECRFVVIDGQKRVILAGAAPLGERKLLVPIRFQGPVAGRPLHDVRSHYTQRQCHEC